MGAIVGATLKDQIQKAMTAHGVYKVKLGQAVETGATDMPVAVVAATDKCPTGDWLGAMDSATKASPHYSTVKDLHATFHKVSADVMALSIARKRTEALGAMEMGSTFKQTSAKLIMALSAWSDSL